MGVDVDNEEMSPGSAGADEAKHTSRALALKRSAIMQNNIHEDYGGMLDHKKAQGNDFPLITSQQNIKLPPPSGVLITGQSKAHHDHIDGGDGISCNQLTSPQPNMPDADRKDMKSQLPHGTPMPLNSNMSTNDKCISLKEYPSHLQPAEIKENEGADTDDTWNCTWNVIPLSKQVVTQQNGILSFVTSERPSNLDIDQTDGEGYTSLYKAALEGQLERVEDLISNGANPNKANAIGRRPLHGAAKEGHVDIIDALIRQGADVNAECDQGQTPLHAAVHSEQHRSAKVLICRGADVNNQDIYGRTPFHSAAAAGHPEIIESLMDESCDINIKDDMGLTMLHHAVRNGHFHVVKHLLLKGARATPYGGESLVYASALSGNVDLVKHFVDAGSNVNEETKIGQNPLHGAASKGHLDVIKYLIQVGCDMNKRDHTDFTPIHAAIMNGHLNVLEYLLKHQAKITKYDGMNVLHLAAVHGHLNIVQYLVSKRNDVNEPNDNDGQTPLHAAADKGHMDVVKYLIEQGCDINKKDNHSRVPLHAASANGRSEIVKYLIDQNSNLNDVDCEGLTALQLAIKHGYLDACKYLAVGLVDDTTLLYTAAVSGHLDIFHFFMYRTSLHFAAANGDSDYLEYLIRQEPDLNICDAKGRTPLYYAIQSNNLEVISCLLLNGADANKLEESPLYMASRLGHLDTVNFLISRQFSVNEENNTGQIPLHAAAANGRIQVVKSLIQNGSDLNKTDYDGWTPFHASVQNGHLQVVKYLMCKGVIDTKYKGMNSIFIAAQAGHLDIVKYFIKGGTDVNDEDSEGRIPLHDAVAQGNIEVVHYLVEQGSALNKGDCDGWTPMHEAVQNGFSEIAMYLLERGARLSRYKGKTPLFMASREGHLGMIDLLISIGADVNEEDYTGRIPLHAAAASGSLSRVKKLIKLGSKVNKLTDKGWSPLHAAVCSGQSDVVKYLIDLGVRETRFAGMTLLYIATQHDYTQLSNYLVSTGCDLNDGTECGRSPLLAASYNGNMDIVKILVIHGACVNQADRNRWTPVHAAAQQGHLATVTYLVKHGADINIKDIDGMTPLQTAEKAGHESIRNFLVQYGGEIHYRHCNVTEKDYSPCGKIVQNFRSLSVQKEDSKVCPGDSSSTINIGNRRRSKATFSKSTLALCRNVMLLPTVSQRNPLFHVLFAVDKVRILKRITEERQFSTQAQDMTDTILFSAAKEELDKVLLLRNSMSEGSESLKIQIFGNIKSGSPKAKPLYESNTSDVTYGKSPLHHHPVWNIHQDREIECRCQLPVEEQGEFQHTVMFNQQDANSQMDPDSPTQPITEKIKPTRMSCVIRPKTRHSDQVLTEDDLPVSRENTGVETSTQTKSESRKTEICFSVPAFLRTFYRIILTLVIFLAGSPGLVAGNIELVTLEAGTSGAVQFNIQRPSNNTFRGNPALHYTLQFKSKRRPFCINGKAHFDGFKSPSQISRFTATVTDIQTSPCVEMRIYNVDIVDEDEYILTAVWHRLDNIQSDNLKKNIVVQLPHYEARCFITSSETEDYPYEVHCKAAIRTIATTLSCYQNDREIDQVHGFIHNGQTIRATFPLPHTTHFSCCTHEITSSVSAATCNDYEWPPGTPHEDTTLSSVTSGPVTEHSNATLNRTGLTDTFTTMPSESNAKSGACGQFTIPCLWLFQYFLIYILALGAIY